MGLFSSIGKFIFGGSKETGKQTSSATQTRTPYAPAVQPINNYLNQTESLYNGGAPMFSDMEKQGYGLLSDIASNGASDYYKTSESTLGKTAEGQYLTPDTNPYLADIAKRISGIAGANTNATFGGKGRSGGGLAGYYAGKAIGDSLTDMYGSVYENERGRQQQAASQAPEFEKSRYDAPQALISAGQNITARPFDLNQQHGGILSNIANLGGTDTRQGTTTDYKNNPGLLGNIVNSFTNALFPKGGAGGGASAPW